LPTSSSTSQEDKREEAKEKILKTIKDSRDPAKAEAVFRGVVAQAGRLVPAEQSWMERKGNRKVVKKEMTTIPEDAFKDVPEIVKRTPQERLESMTQRLVQQYRKDPNTLDALLREIQSEILRQRGYDVRFLHYDDMKRVAQHFLERAEQMAKDNPQPHSKDDKKVDDGS